MTHATDEKGAAHEGSRETITCLSARWDLRAAHPRRGPARDRLYQHAFGWNIGMNRQDPSFQHGTGHVIGHFVSDGGVAGEAGVCPYIYLHSVDAAITHVTTHGGAAADEP